MQIEITVRDKIARLVNKHDFAVCGNSDYTIKFDFDSEWDAYETKTARFKWNGSYTDVVFSGSECPMPIITNAFRVEIGVYAGELHTTSSAVLPLRKSILCGNETESEVSREIKENLDEVVKSKITAPQTANVGEVLTVEKVDEDGKPTKWKTEKKQNAVLYKYQSLTNAEKRTARENISALTDNTYSNWETVMDRLASNDTFRDKLFVVSSRETITDSESGDELQCPAILMSHGHEIDSVQFTAWDSNGDVFYGSVWKPYEGGYNISKTTKLKVLKIILTSNTDDDGNTIYSIDKTGKEIVDAVENGIAVLCFDDKYDTGSKSQFNLSYWRKSYINHEGVINLLCKEYAFANIIDGENSEIFKIYVRDSDKEVVRIIADFESSYNPTNAVFTLFGDGNQAWYYMETFNTFMYFNQEGRADASICSLALNPDGYSNGTEFFFLTGTGLFRDMDSDGDERLRVYFDDSEHNVRYILTPTRIQKKYENGAYGDYYPQVCSVIIEELEKQADWNQNDSTAADFVKNRPFWTGDPEEKEVFNTVIRYDEPYYEQGKEFEWLEEGKTYSVKFNDRVYNLICRDAYGDGSCFILGNEYLFDIGLENTEEPFYIISMHLEDVAFLEIQFSLFEDLQSEEVAMTITGTLEEVSKINSKYLPVARENIEGIISYQKIKSIVSINKGFNINIGETTFAQVNSHLQKTALPKIFYGVRTLVVLSYSIQLQGSRGFFLAECIDLTNHTFGEAAIWFPATLDEETGMSTEYENSAINEYTYYDAPKFMKLNSSTLGSMKQFKITVDDSGTISATEITE